MYKLDVTLTYALPVCAEALAVKMQTHVETLPALNMMRLCLRFGHGGFKELPVELVKKIETYVVEPVRKKVAKELSDASRCFELRCSILDHAARDILLRAYSKFAVGMNTPRAEGAVGDPTDRELQHVLEGVEQENLSQFFDEEGAHEANKDAWRGTIHEIFCFNNLSMFQKRFGLDIWCSFDREHSRCLFTQDDIPQAVITYLTLPEPVTGEHEWPENCEHNAHEPRVPYGQNGFGMAVEICKQPSADELGKFSAALKFLKLDVFVYDKQQQYCALEIGSSMKDVEVDAPRNFEAYHKLLRSSNDKDKAMVPFPRPTLLTRTYDEPCHIGWSTVGADLSALYAHRG